MTAGSACPEPGRLQELLEGSLANDSEQQLSSHLDTCENCQLTLDQLAAAQSMPRPAPGPRQQESALRRAIQQLKRQPSEAETLLGASTHDQADLDFLQPCDAPEAIGRFGPYEVREVVGRGGMGTVLKAYDPALARLVAVKVIAAHLASTDMHRKRFLREARTAASISHEHVVRVHAVAECDSRPYLVMEYVAGVSLQDRMDRGDKLTVAEIVRIGAEAADGLAAAHTAELIHRDIKPANLLQDGKTGRIKITDFGLARAVGDASLTQSGVVAGTPHYMAPEQARGAVLDHRADLFSLGSVLYALCTGKAPFSGEVAVAILYNVCHESPRPIREINRHIPDWLAAVVDKLHQKQPADRFQSAAALSSLLRQYLVHLEHPNTTPLPEGPAQLLPSPTTSVMPSPQILARLGREYRSTRTVWGWPLVHVATGIDPQTGKKRIARGVIAIGDIAIGAVAIGGLALGGITLGGVSFGLVSLGGFAIGLLLAFGGGAVGGLAMGGGALGLVAIGGAAAGYYAFGGSAFGVHALGSNVQDPAAVAFFSEYLGDWVKRLGRPY